MSGGEPQGDKHVKFTPGSTERLGKWAEGASDEDYGLVCQVLFQVVEGSWRRECEHSQDAVHRLTWHIRVRAGLIVTVRFAKEYPTMVQLIYIGPLSG